MDFLPPMLESTEPSPITAECITQASQDYGFHPDILLVILYVEGGEVGIQNNERYGERDIGPAQVNSIHLQDLEKVGISEIELRYDGCKNISAMAWYLDKVTKGLPAPRNETQYLSQIARYHSKTPEYNIPYAKRLKAAFKFIYSKRAGR